MDVAEKKMKILFYHWPSEAVFLQYLFSGLSCLFVLQRKHAMSQHLSTLLQTTAAALEMLQKNKKEAAWVLFALVVGFNTGLRTFAFFCSFWKVVLVLLKGWSTIADHQGLHKHPLSTHFPSYLQTLWGGMNFGYGFLNKMINASQSAQNIAHWLPQMPPASCGEKRNCISYFLVQRQSENICANMQYIGTLCNALKIPS